ncbi:MAG TPA: MFS transporter, partial [Chloroflexota bacterium]
MSQVAVRPARPATAPLAVDRAPADAGWRRTFAALRHRDFAVLMLSALAHMLAMQMGMVAFGYMAYQISGSATALGLMGLAWGIPMLTLSLVGGVVADRLPRRTILTVTQATVGAGALVNALLIYSGQLRLWHLFAVALVQGT